MGQQFTELTLDKPLFDEVLKISQNGRFAEFFSLTLKKQLMIQQNVQTRTELARTKAVVQPRTWLDIRKSCVGHHTGVDSAGWFMRSTRALRTKKTQTKNCVLF